MKIISRGTIPTKEAPLRTTCTNCRTIFEFAKAEAEPVEHVFGTVYRVLCPVCVTTQSVYR